MQQNHLSDDQILSRLCVYYQDDFNEKVKSILQPDEILAWAGNFSFSCFSFSEIGYVLVTTDRIMRISFKTKKGWFTSRKQVKITQGDVVIIAYDNPDYPLSEAEKGSRHIDEIFIKKLETINRQEFCKTDQKIIEIKINNILPMRFINTNEANEVYNLLYGLTKKNHNQGQIIPPNFPELLQKLEDLYKYQIIDDETYNAAKRKLLS